MNNGWKFAGVGVLGGASLAIVLILAGTWAGLMPPNPNDAVGDAAIHRYLTAHPEEIVAMTNALQEQENKQDEANDRARQKAVNKLGAAAFFDPKVAFVLGPANAKTTIVEFFDYNCPYCRQSTPAVRQFYETHRNDTRFALVEFPIKGPESTVAARAAIAARYQPDKYLAFHFMLMAEKELVYEDLIYADAAKAGLDVAKLKADMKDASVDRSIAAAHKLADKLGINATPTFIINGNVRPGAVDDKTLAQMVKG